MGRPNRLFGQLYNDERNRKGCSVNRIMTSEKPNRLFGQQERIK